MPRTPPAAPLPGGAVRSAGRPSRRDRRLRPSLDGLEPRQLLSTVAVSGLCNIYGSGTSALPDPGGGGGGIAPIEVSLSSLGGPKTVDFPTVTGEVSARAVTGLYNGADGGSYFGGATDLQAVGGISGIHDGDATMFLVGVFLGPNGQPAKPPATPDVTGANGVASFSPPIGQLFFVGDGRTSAGAVQTFNVPAGATRLFLGFADGYQFGHPNPKTGWYSDNGGVLTVDVEPLPAPDFFRWDDADGGVDYGFLAAKTLSQAVPVDFYWSAGPTFDAAQDTLAATATIQPGQAETSLHVKAASLAAPPSDAEYLLAVLDPNHTVLPAGTANVLSLDYDPDITLTGKYNGSPDPDTIGRFLAVPGVVTGETFTAKLSESLAALRPYVSTWVGDGAVLSAHHKTTGLFNSWDGVSYETDAFDPGTLTGPTTLNTEAFLTGGTELESVDTTLDVQPLPAWIGALGDPKFSFEPVGNGGVYTLNGVFDTLNIPASAMTVPTTVNGYAIPFIGGSSLSVAAKMALSVSVDLDPVKAPPSVSGNVGVTASLFGANEGGAVPKADVTVTPTVGLDPETLVPDGTFGVTLGFTYTRELKNYTVYSKTVTLLDPPGLSVGLDVLGDETLNVGGTLALDLGSGDTLAVVPDTTKLQVGVTTKITGSVKVGYFVPAGALKTTLEKWLGVTKLPSLAFSSSVTGSLEIHGAATYTDDGAPITPTFGGTLVFDPMPELSFTIGTGTFTASSPRPIEVYKLTNYPFGT